MQTTASLIEANILDLLGLQQLPEARKTELLTRMTEVIQDRISDRILEVLSADDRTAFDRLLERGASPDELDSFLKAKVPEFSQIVAEEVLRFKAQMVDDVAVVRKIASERKTLRPEERGTLRSEAQP